VLELARVTVRNYPAKGVRVVILDPAKLSEFVGAVCDHLTQVVANRRVGTNCEFA